MTKKFVTTRYLEIIDAIIREKGWSQSEFCRQMNYDDTLISRLRMKGWEVSAQRLIELKAAFPLVNIGYCFGETTKMMQEPTPVNRHNNIKKTKSASYKR